MARQLCPEISEVDLEEPTSLSYWEDHCQRMKKRLPRSARDWRATQRIRQCRAEV